VLQRFPDGIDEFGFYQKNTPDHVPDWIGRIEVDTADGGITRYPVVDDAAGLIYLANQGGIVFHTLLASAEAPTTPIEVIFDLDPSSDDLGPVRAAATELRSVLDDLDLAPRVKSSGSRGLHIVVDVTDIADGGGRGSGRGGGGGGGGGHGCRWGPCVSQGRYCTPCLLAGILQLLFRRSPDGSERSRGLRHNVVDLNAGGSPHVIDLCHGGRSGRIDQCWVRQGADLSLESRDHEVHVVLSLFGDGLDLLGTLIEIFRCRHRPSHQKDSGEEHRNRKDASPRCVHSCSSSRWAATLEG
jgi:hypothetical protein